jgi:hypothetical protein
MQNIWMRLCILFVICTLNRPLVMGAQNLASQERMNWDEFKSALMKRYDQKVVVTRVSGLQAGEKKSSFGTGQAGDALAPFPLKYSAPRKSYQRPVDEQKTVRHAAVGRPHIWNVNSGS